jgi:hypothetical protein
MYFNRMQEVRVMEIIVYQAAASYEPWLKRFGAPYWEGNERVRVGDISLHLPSSWPAGQLMGGLPEWLQREYSFDELNRKIHPSAPGALYDIGRPHEQNFEDQVVKLGGMTLYVLEGCRLHLMASAAFSASQNKEPWVTGEDVREVAKWKCWAWPFC